MINKGVLIILFSIFLTSISQILLKLSSDKKYNHKIREYLNFYVIFSYSMFFITMLLNTFALKFIDMKSIQVFMALSYGIVLVLSKLILKEEITKNKLIGNIIIIMGVIIFNI